MKTIITFVLTAILLTFVLPVQAEWLEATTRELQLVKDFSRCVDYGSVIVDKECLRSALTREFGLRPDEVRYGTFSSSASGKSFNLLVKKSSRSGGTVGLFNVAVYLERYGAFNGTGLYLITFTAHGGGLYGAIPADSEGLVSIYDLSRGDRLVNDETGKTINSLDLPSSLYWSPKHTAGQLINSGKTIGYILEEHLENVEKANKGGPTYTRSSEDRLRTFEGMGPKYQLKVLFD